MEENQSDSDSNNIIFNINVNNEEYIIDSSSLLEINNIEENIEPNLPIDNIYNAEWQPPNSFPTYVYSPSYNPSEQITATTSINNTWEDDDDQTPGNLQYYSEGWEGGLIDDNSGAWEEAEANTAANSEDNEGWIDQSPADTPDWLLPPTESSSSEIIDPIQQAETQNSQYELLNNDDPNNPFNKCKVEPLDYETDEEEVEHLSSVCKSTEAEVSACIPFFLLPKPLCFVRVLIPNAVFQS